MTLSRSYVAELELLITDTFMPVYERYYRDKGGTPEYSGVTLDLLKQVKKRKTVPALLLPKKN